MGAKKEGPCSPGQEPSVLAVLIGNMGFADVETHSRNNRIGPAAWKTLVRCFGALRATPSSDSFEHHRGTNE
jgi:hypothetical protein